MEQFLSIFAYLSVIARAAFLALQTLVIGCLAFVLLVSKGSLGRFDADRKAVEERVRRVLFWAAVVLALVQTLFAGSNTSILMSTSGLSFRDAIGAQYFLASAMTVLASVGVALIARTRLPLLSAAPLAVIILAGSVATGHAWSRLSDRGLLSSFDLVHQAAAGIWVGGLPALLLALGTVRTQAAADALAKRFSRLALLGVCLLFLAGIGLAYFYIDSPSAAYGTTYGIMLLAKLALFVVLLGIGAMNRSLVSRLPVDSSRLLKFLRRNVEAEIGIGFTVVLAAASLTSQPPAIDLPTDRLQLSEIRDLYTPRWPRFSSPDASQLKVPERQRLKQEAEREGRVSTYVPGSAPGKPETPEGKAWSEYNHHWAGLALLLMGVLAMLARSRSTALARHWPLLFIGMAVFILLRADPENWPLGPNGFWESFLETDVLQHRFAAVLITAFAVFEWRVQTGRSLRRIHAYVFPAVCALGGALLFTHSHALGNIREETLVEWSHIPLAFLAVIAGWSRWAELRGDPAKRNGLAWIWSTCFALIGIVLLLYREP